MISTIFTYHLSIQAAHLDSFGHVNNAVYLTLLEQARWDLMLRHDYGLEKIKSTGLGPTILAIEIRFIKELVLHDDIVIETQVTSYEKKIAKILQRIYRDKIICCEAIFTIALFDLNKRKLVLPTPDWLTAIGVTKTVLDPS